MLPDNIKAEAGKQEYSLTGKASRILTTNRIAADAGHVYSCARNLLIIAITELYPGKRNSLALISLYLTSECKASLVEQSWVMMLLRFHRRRCKERRVLVNFWVPGSFVHERKCHCRRSFGVKVIEGEALHVKTRTRQRNKSPPKSSFRVFFFLYLFIFPAGEILWIQINLCCCFCNGS